MERNELNAVALADGGRGVTRHPRIGVGVAEPGLPTVVDITLQLGLEAANPVLARQDEKSRVVRIGQRNVGANQGNLEQYSLSAISVLAERAVAALVPR